MGSANTKIEITDIDTGEDASVTLRGTKGAVAIEVLDSNGDQVTSFGDTITSISPGTVATNLGKAESAAHTSGDVGVMPLAVRNDNFDAKASDGQYHPLQVDDKGALQAVIGDGVVVSGTVGLSSSQQGATGTITTNGASVSLADPNNNGTARIHITNTWTGTLQFEGTVDGTNYVVIEAYDHANADSVLTTTGNGVFSLAFGAFHTIRVTSTAFVSGTATITWAGGLGSVVHYLVGSLPTGSNTIGVVDLGSTDNAVLDAIAASLSVLDDWDDTNYANVNVNMAGTDAATNSGTLNAQTQRVTIATDDEVNNLLGTIDTDTSSMATDLGTIDTDTGAMVVDLAAIEALLITIDSDTNTIQGDTSAILADTAAMDTNLATIAGDTTSIQTAIELIDGAIIGPGEPTIDSVTQFAINLGAAANQVLVSSAANKQIWVYAVAYTLSVAGTVSFQDEDDTAITGIMDHAANSGMAVGPSGNFSMPLWKLGTDKDLEVDVVTASIDGWITYAIVSV